MNVRQNSAFEVGNASNSAAVAALMDIPGQMNGEFANAYNLFNSVPALVTLPNGLPPVSWDSTIVSQISQGSTPSVAATAPAAALPQALGPGQLYPYYPGMNSAPNYSIYGSLGTAFYNTVTNAGSGSAYISMSGPLPSGVVSQTAYGSVAYNNGVGSPSGESFTLTGNFSRLYQNGDMDNWAANFQIDTSGLDGNLSVTSKRGPLSVHADVQFNNSIVVTRNASIDYVLPNHELHLAYHESPSNVTMTGSYRNTVAENITLMADYSYDSDVGTKVTAGSAIWVNETNYVEMFAGRNTPLNGPSLNIASARGVMLTTNPLVSLQHDIVVTNGITNDNSVFIDVLSAPTKTPFAWRTIFLQDYDSFTSGLGLTYGY